MIDDHIRTKFGIDRDLTEGPLIGVLDRTHLGSLFNELNYKVGAEIGVAYGANSEVLLKANPGLKLFCVDPWTPYKHWSERRMRNRYQTTVQRLQTYNAVILRKSSMEALVDIPDSSLDFVYIDAMHDYRNVRKDIDGWVPKVRSGGIVSGHDYSDLHHCGVLRAVNEFVLNHNIFPWYLTNEPALPSWFWVKA